jgi:hypothetical protein
VNGLLKQLTKALIERALEAEMTEHLGHARHECCGYTLQDTLLQCLKLSMVQMSREKPRGRPGLAVRDNQRGTAPASGVVRTVRGTNSVRGVARHDAALAERKGVAMETLSPQFERTA